MRKWRIVGINFDHMHMDYLLGLAFDHPQAEIVGICHETPNKMTAVAQKYNIPDDLIFTDYRQCLEKTNPDIAMLCPATARHGEWTEKVAAYDVHIMVEKPFAATLAEADRMITVVAQANKQLAINWPLAWYPPHVTTKRLIDEGVIGDVIEVHYYDGNKADGFTGDNAWFLKKDQGGGSLLDYLGYGATLATWFMDNRVPLAVTAVAYTPPGWEVDNHSISIVEYEEGLSKLETRWGTLTHPWEYQPQPKCGFVVVGTQGNISSYDYEPTIRLQTIGEPEGEVIPVDELQPPYLEPVGYFIHCLENDQPISGPLSVETSRIGQRIVDTAVRSAVEQKRVPLL